MTHLSVGSVKCGHQGCSALVLEGRGFCTTHAVLLRREWEMVKAGQWRAEQTARTAARKAADEARRRVMWAGRRREQAARAASGGAFGAALRAVA